MQGYGFPTEIARSIRVPTIVMSGDKTFKQLREPVRLARETIPGARFASLPGQSHKRGRRTWLPRPHRFLHRRRRHPHRRLIHEPPMTDHLSMTLSALADPTRRGILARLATGEATVSELAEPYDMSMAAVSKHLKVLEKAGLISRGKEAQWRPCKLEAAPMREVSDWVENYRRFWDEDLDHLGDYLAELQKGDLAAPGTSPGPRAAEHGTTKGHRAFGLEAARRSLAPARTAGRNRTLVRHLLAVLGRKPGPPRRLPQ